MIRYIISYNSANMCKYIYIYVYVISAMYRITSPIIHLSLKHPTFWRQQKKTNPGHGTILPGVSNTGIPGRAAAGSGRTYHEVFLQARPRLVRQARQASKPRSNPNTTCFPPYRLRWFFEIYLFVFISTHQNRTCYIMLFCCFHPWQIGGLQTWKNLCDI